MDVSRDAARQLAPANGLDAPATTTTAPPKVGSVRNESDGRLKVADRPSGLWTAASSFTMYAVARLCRAFLYGASRVELSGQEEFFQLLESRAERDKRKRGLITVSNHISVYALCCYC
ncbi:hypothetical protein KEM52_005777, partial [Ascosphaera acerosa]